MGSWDPVWEEIYQARDWGRYPPEELVRFIGGNFFHDKNRHNISILDLGCGQGACTWFLSREGFSVSGIDGSKNAIEKAKKRLHSEKLSADFHVGDFCSLPWETAHFDVVIDIVSLTCNTKLQSTQIIKEIFRVLKPGGIFFSMSFKDGCWGDGSGLQLEDHTFTDIPEGPMAHMGITRFSTESELRSLYSMFCILSFEYSIRSIDNMKHVISHWVVVGKKVMIT